MIDDLVTFKNEFYLSQEVNTPTHRKGNVLDLIFTNNSEMLHSYECNDTILSDHYLINAKINYKNEVQENGEEAISSETSTTNFDRLNFFSEKIDWKKVKQNLKEFNWRAEFRGCPPEMMLARFFSICFSICAKHIPQKRKIQKTVRNKIPRDRKNLMRKRQRRLKLCPKHDHPTIKLNFWLR